MKFLSPHPQTPRIEKDRLGNTIPPSRESPFAVSLWTAVIVGVTVGATSGLVRDSGFIFQDFWMRVADTAVAMLSFGVLYLLNRALDLFSWYRDFKRSPLLINGTNLILAGIALFICWQALMGKLH